MTKSPASGKALLVIDMLNDFVLPDAPLQVPSATDIIPFLQQRLEQERDREIPVIYLCDAHDPDDPEFQIWPPHAVEGTPGARVIDILAPLPKDTLVKKKRYSGFCESQLDQTLKRLRVNHLMVTGLVTNICVLYTVAEARSRGYEVTVFQDSVAGLDPEDHYFALKQMREVFKATVL